MKQSPPTGILIVVSIPAALLEKQWTTDGNTKYYDMDDILIWGEKKCMTRDSQKLWKKPWLCLANAEYSFPPKASKFL